MDHDLLHHLEGFLSDDRKLRFLDILANRTRYITIALEDVYQLHNTSAVIRSCDAFGIQDAHLIEGRFGRRLDKNISMGAQQWVDVHRHRSAEACMDSLRGAGYRIVATSPHDGALSPDHLDLSRPVAIFFGTEKEGLSEVVVERAEATIRIPMVGFTESLNISVAAAIILNVVANRLRSSDISWQLTPDEILEKRFDWARNSIKSASDIIDRYRGTT